MDHRQVFQSALDAIILSLQSQFPLPFLLSNYNIYNAMAIEEKLQHHTRSAENSLNLTELHEEGNEGTNKQEFTFIVNQEENIRNVQPCSYVRVRLNASQPRRRPRIAQGSRSRTESSASGTRSTAAAASAAA